MLALVVALSLGQSINIRDEGVPQSWARTVDCVGSGLTCAVDTATRIATFTSSGGGGGGLPDGGDISGEPFITYSATSVLSADRVLSAGNYTTINTGTAGQAKVDWAHGLTCSAGQALTSSGTSAMACVSNVATATALAADPTDCTAGQYATTIAASGNLTCAQVAYSQLSGTPTIPADTSGYSFVTKVAEAGLSNELALGTLATGVLVNTTTTGVPTIKAANTCSNQFARSDTASGVWTCNSVGLNDFTPNLGSSAQVLHGNAVGQPSFSSIVPNDLTASAFEQSVVLTGAGYFQQAVSFVGTTASSKVVCRPFGTTADGLTPEVIAISMLQATVSDLSAGVGLNLNVYNPNGLVGTVRFHCIAGG